MITHSRRKTVSMLISTIGVQPTSFSLPREVFKPRAEMEIKMNSLEISPSVLETFVGIIPVQFKAARAMKPSRNIGMFLYQGLAFSSSVRCALEEKTNMKMMRIGIRRATRIIFVKLAISSASGPIMAPAPTTCATP